MDTLTERYLAAVSEKLPARQRQDTVTEIRSLIQDAVEDRSKSEGKPVDDEIVAAVLKEFGPPEKIVAPYLPEQYLIGPQLYPTFIMVLRIALPVIAVLVLVTSWIGLSQRSLQPSSQLLTSLAESFGNALSSVVAAFGNIVLIFAILQWAIPGFKVTQKEWDPRSLKAVSKPDKIKRGELITEIVFTLLALIIFNFYFDRIGIYNNLNGEWSYTPVLTSAFTAYVPWLSLLWILTIALDVLLLRKNSWNVPTRLFAILVSATNIAIAASLMSHIPLLYTLEGALGELGTEGIVQSILNQVLILVFAIVIITSVVKIIQMAWRLVRGGSSQAGSPVS